MFQQHQLDANGKLLRRFYEPLVLLSVLDPARGAQRPDLTSDLGLHKHLKLWRNFLDQIAFLCDCEKGGENTVTAVAAEKSNEQPIFWIASNSKFRDKTRKHIYWILARLNHIHGSDKTDDDLETEILWRCIAFSRARIKVDTQWLIMQAIGKAKKTLKESGKLEGGYEITTFGGRRTAFV